MMHLARFTAIGTEKSHPADDARRAEQLRQRLFIAQAILQSQDLRTLAQQRPDQLGKTFIGKGLQPHQHQIYRTDFFRSTVPLNVRQGKITIDGKDLEAVP